MNGHDSKDKVSLVLHNPNGTEVRCDFDPGTVPLEEMFLRGLDMAFENGRGSVPVVAGRRADIEVVIPDDYNPYRAAQDPGFEKRVENL